MEIGYQEEYTIIEVEIMNIDKIKMMHENKGFIAALDQSGGSTPKALKLYGILEDKYHNEKEMFDLVHEMRKRIITSPSFTNKHIIGAILFEKTMDSKIEGRYSADYLFDVKGILPFLKIDKGLEKIENGVQLMKPMENLESLLERAVRRNIFGTKMRSVIKEFNEEGIKKVVQQQFSVAKIVMSYGLVPIIEPEIDIMMEDKARAEDLLLKYLIEELNKLPNESRVIFKITIPSKANLYLPLINNQRTIRVVALSGGYQRAEAIKLLSENKGVIASFSRAFTEGLTIDQTNDEFNLTLLNSIKAIYEASVK